jgi:hypothetical protein
MKVECIRDVNQGLGWDGATFGDLIQYGEIYEVIGSYRASDGYEFYLLRGLKRNNPLWGDGWGMHRFRPLRTSNLKMTNKEYELVG